MLLEGEQQIQLFNSCQTKGKIMFKKIGIIVIFISCFVIAKYAVQFGMEKYRENKVITAVEEAYSEIEKEAESNNTGISKSAAIQETAIKKVEQKINSKNSPQQKKETAISTFMGFYLVNYRTRSDFCEALGISIPTFTNKFKEIHRNELNLSNKIVFKNDGDVDNLYKLVQAQLEKIVTQDMNDIASQYGVNTTGACQLVEDNGITFAESMHVSKIQPTVYKEIHN